MPVGLLLDVGPDYGTFIAFLIITPILVLRVYTISPTVLHLIPLEQWTLGT